MARTALEDPIKVFRYRIYIPGGDGSAFGFSEMTGLESETEVAEYREGGMNSTPQKSPGITKFADIVLKRGQIVSSGAGTNFMFDWVESVYSATRSAAQGSTVQDFRKIISIDQYNSINVVVRKWEVSEAWPKKWKPFSDLNGTSSDNSIEELTIAHEGFRRIL